MPTLVQARTAYDEKRGALAEIFKQAGPDLDMSKVTLIDGDEAKKLDEIRRRNDEIGELRDTFEGLKAAAEMAEANRKGLEEMNAPVRGFPFTADGSAAAQDERKQAQKSIGQLFVESDAYKSYDKTKRMGPTVDLPAGGMIGTKTVLTETGFAPQAVRTGLIEPAALRRPVIADLMPSGTTQMNAIVYMLETTTTNAAAAVTEGSAKPESALAFTEQNSPVRKVATILPITDELLADVPALQSYIEARLRIFLMLAEETELYSGSGVAPHITGLTNVSGILTQAKGADNAADAIFKAMINIETTSFLSPSGVIMHPTDWQTIRLLKTTTGAYVWGDPSTPGTERVWGIDVVRTPAATQGTALVGAFDTATQVFRRDGVSFAISDQHSDFFIRNQLMLRIEERLALAVYRPSALATVTGL